MIASDRDAGLTTRVLEPAHACDLGIGNCPPPVHHGEVSSQERSVPSLYLGNGKRWPDAAVESNMAPRLGVDRRPEDFGCYLQETGAEPGVSQKW